LNRYKIIAAVTNDLSQDQRMHRICKSLAAEGYDVTLVGRRCKDSLLLPEFSFSTKRLNCFFNKGFLFYAEYNIRLLMFLLSNSFSVVNAIDTDTLMAAAIAARIKNKLLSVDFHELYAEVPELKDAPFKKAAWNRIESIFIKRAHLVYTVNNSLAAIFGKKHGLDVRAVYNYPMQQEDIKSKSLCKPVKLLYQGKINNGRGIKEVIGAAKNIEDIEVHIIGDGDLFEEAKSWIGAFSNKIILHGFVPPESLTQMTSHYDIGINLLEKNSLSYFYSSANKYYDYMMAGIPSISMNFPEYRSVNEQFKVGVLIDNLNEESIRNGINEVIEHYATLHANCIQARKTLHWGTQEDKLIALYNGILPRVASC